MLGLTEVDAVQAARWLDQAGLLGDSPSRPGKPLRDRLRAGRIHCGVQRPPQEHGRWFIIGADEEPGSQPPTPRSAPPTSQPFGMPSADSAGVTLRRSCTADEAQHAIAVLSDRAARISARDWPGRLSQINTPGMYSWWVDGGGASDLSLGLDNPVGAGLIYAGQTGATKWPSGKRGSQTLAARVGGNHLRGSTRGSTFRLTLAACLSAQLGLRAAAPRRLDPVSEENLTDWMQQHLEVAVTTFQNADALRDLERQVLATLDPPLNLDGMPPTAVRRALSARRSQLA